MENIVNFLSELNTRFGLLSYAFNLLGSTEHLDNKTAETFSFFERMIKQTSEEFNIGVTELRKILNLDNKQKEKEKNIMENNNGAISNITDKLEGVVAVLSELGCTFDLLSTSDNENVAEAFSFYERIIRGTSNWLSEITSELMKIAN